MNWYQHAHNPEAITSIFLKPPTLSKVRLLGIDLSLQSGEVLLYIELKEFPDNPSPRWGGKGFTVAQAKIGFFGVKSLVISGWEKDEDISIQIDRNQGDKLCLIGKGLLGEVRFEFAAFRIAAISGYSYAREK